MTRAYKSELRTEQAAQTRERIVAALVEQLGEGGDEFSIPDVAERAGVSVRTVYHHFPNREAQIEAAAAWLDARIAGNEAGPTTLADVPAMAERIIARALENEPIVRAQLVPGVARHVRDRRRRAREQAIARAVAAEADGEAGKLAAAALVTLISAELGFAIKDRFGLDGEQTAAAHTWIIRVVVDAIRRGDTPQTARTARRRRGD